MRQTIQTSANIDEEEEGIPTEEAHEAMEVLKREKLEKMDVIDPESRLMRDIRKVIQPCYNCQIAVDDKEQVNVVADVSQNATDHANFKPVVEQVECNLGVLPKEGSADAGYSSYEIT